MKSASVRCKPVESASVRHKPVESASVERKPVESVSVRCKPMESACQSALTRVSTFSTSIGDLWERTLEPGSFADLSHLEPPWSVLRADCLLDMVSDG